MRYIRRFIYWFGWRPKPGSRFYSLWLATRYKLLDEAFYGINVEEYYAQKNQSDSSKDS